MVYDGDCGFCTLSARWLERRGVPIVPWQSLDLRSVGLTEHDVTTAAWWLEGGTPVAGGAGAVAAGLRAAGRPWRWLGRALDAGPVRPLADRVYAVVARNRHRLPGSTEACRLPG
jgi:predicted DCC family thiol-disulfide oxidoreductase YuxK